MGGKKLAQPKRSLANEAPHAKLLAMLKRYYLIY
jgi:hypothetical protein